MNNGVAGPISPELSAEQLARLAATNPEYWPQIVQHPNVYPDLQVWITQSQQAQAAQAQQAASALVTPEAFSPKDRQPRKKSTVVIASVVAGALVLGGGAALALTNTWPFNGGGPLAGVVGNDATTASSAEEAPTFTDGIEEKWTVSGSDLGDDAQLMGHLPRMMGPINHADRADQPIQLQFGVLVSYRPSDSSGDVPASWALLDPETGETIWTEAGWGYPSSCAVNLDRTEAVCNTSFVSGSKLIGFNENGIAFHEDSEPGAVHYSNGFIQVSGSSGAYLWSTDGELIREEPVDGTSAGTASNAEFPECVWIYAADSISYAGSDCTQDPEKVLINADAFNWALVQDANPKILFSANGSVALFDAQRREKVWEKDGGFTGWYQSPQTVQGENGEAVLMQRDAGNSSYYALIDLKTGEETKFSAEGGDAVGVVAGGQVLIFTGEPAYDETINRVQIFDPETGGKTADHEIPAIENVAEIIGGPHGVMFGHRLCTDCSTAEGSHSIDSYTFLGPGSSGTDGVEAGSVEVPDGIPGCPSDTVLLAWAELSDGWVLVCGITLEQPSYVAYQPTSGAKTVYSVGAKNPTSSDAKGAVTWDADLKRYTTEMSGGNRVVFDYDLGMLTVRDDSGATTLGQYRCVRYIFMVLGEKVRTVKESAGQSGAFDVETPDATAEDQVRYMIEVLEKAYEGRALVKETLPKLRACKAGVGGYTDSIAAMESVRDNRAELLVALDAMPVDKIPDGELLLDDLTEAIDASYRANVEYVAWAEAANASGCAALSAAGQAAAAASDAPKERFAERWNRVVASKYGVRTFDAWYI